MARKPKAVIFDVDGTLSSMSWRVHYLDQNPPDWNAFHSGMVLDRPAEAMAGAARAYHEQGYRVIALTLRPERFREATQQWFADHDIPFDDLYLRPTGDYRDGAIVKREIYEKQIKPAHEVHMAFDDYPKMVSMWERAGVPATTVKDPGHRPLSGVPAVDPRTKISIGLPSVSVAGDTTPKEEAGSAYTTGDDLRHGGRITERGHLDVGGGHRLRTWIPPHPSTTKTGEPTRVRGHWRKLGKKKVGLAGADVTREMFWLRVRGQDPDGARPRVGVSRLRGALRGGSDEVPRA